MTVYTEHDVLNARTQINTIIQNDSDLGALLSFTNARTKETEYRIYKTPLYSNVIKGTSFSTYFLGEAIWNERFEKRIPVMYSDVAVQNSILENAVDEAWLIAQAVIAALMENPNLNGTAGHHRITDIEPVEPEKDAGLWTFILTLKHEIYPQGYLP